MSTVKSAFKAFVFNKISDICILLAIMLIAHLNMDFSIASFNSNLLVYMNSDVKFLEKNYSSIELIAFFLQ